MISAGEAFDMRQQPLYWERVQGDKENAILERALEAQLDARSKPVLGDEPKLKMHTLVFLYHDVNVG